MTVEIHRDDQGNYAGVSSARTAGAVDEVPEGYALVAGGDGRYLLEIPIGPPSDDPWENGPPEDDRLVMLETDYAAWTAMLDRYSAEMAGIPSLRHEALINEDFKTLHRADDRYVELKAVIANATIGQARARLALAYGRAAIALVNRDAASQEAYRLGLVSGMPEGLAKADAALAAKGGAELDLSFARTAVVEARAALRAAEAAIGGNHGKG